MAIFDIFFPKHCPVCLRPLFPDGRLICPTCAGRIPYAGSPACFLCGAPITEEGEETCANCKNGRSFDRGAAYALYEDPAMRRMIGRVKFHGEVQLLDYPCRDFALRKRELLLSLGAEALVPVPVSGKRFKERGFNQAEEIAKRMQPVLGIPVAADVLFRTGESSDQKTLTRIERRENLFRAFRAAERAGGLKSVILVDDILTTGSTMNACAAALKRAGVRKVFSASLLVVRGAEDG